ncbi:hypothetical protein V6N11_017453 [Hibiscus sabdariffa]|uniref:Uncharacterized protein n=2 Tax=Hibiscus sabdariffa TaxID=183260 RepID=A0ABR2TY17_9ROSI
MKFTSLWGISSVFPKMLSHFIQAWHEVSLIKNVNSIWHTILFAVLWTTWLNHNEMVFDNGFLDAHQTFFLAKTRLALWFKEKHQSVGVSIEEVVANPPIADRLFFKLRTLSKLSWKALPRWFLKLNIDGTMVENVL